MPKIVLITGANRGLGLGLLKLYLELPDHLLIATVRDPSHPSSISLSSLPKHATTRLITVKLDANVASAPASVVEEIQSKHGVKRLDVVIANAGISYIHPLVKDLKIEDIQAHITTNVYGMVHLYQATRGLLEESKKDGEYEPAFVYIGSTAAWLKALPPVPNAAYGPSKVAAHWLIVRLHAEDEWLNAFVMDPGWVQTDMGTEGAKKLGFEDAPTTVEDSCKGMMERLQETSREKHGGKFVHFDTGVEEW